MRQFTKPNSEMKKMKSLGTVLKCSTNSWCNSFCFFTANSVMKPLNSLVTTSKHWPRETNASHPGATEPQRTQVKTK